MAGCAPVIIVSLLKVPLVAQQIPVLIIPVAIAAIAYYLLDTGLIAIAISVPGRLLSHPASPTSAS